ncbi:MAG TPA: hypothetical protein VML94_07660 [Thermoplasmata archaeon]|nr:hypothetical protein [Thermoplasmata archaeon]
MRPRSVALVTRDPALYHDLAGFLRERRLPSVSLLPGDRIPDRVAVVLTSPDELELIEHPRVLTVSEGGDRRALGAAITQALQPSEPDDELVVGIDPGPRPGYAILSGARCIGEGILEGPEAAGALAAQLRHRFPGRALRFRVGVGDPPARNRIVNSLVRRFRTVELVNEDGTTPRGRRRPRDAEAARSIARTSGTPVREPMVGTFTPGEISNLQRLSREGSGGRVTISRSSAHRVLRGEISLADAVDQTLRAPRPARVREPL